MELWKAITGYEGLYEVSNYGNVRSLDREVTSAVSTRCKSFTRKLKGASVVISKYKNGYCRVSLSKDGKSKYVLLHRLVAKAFIEHDDWTLEVNHIDGDEENNRHDNLEWCTSKENSRHAMETGLARFARGEESGNSKLTLEQAMLIKEKLSNNERIKDIACDMGLTIKMVGDIKRDRTWRNI